MRAAVLHETGGELKVEEMTTPPGATLQVHAVGVNYADVLIRAGRYPQMPELPFVPGIEVAGDLGDTPRRRARAGDGGRLCRAGCGRPRVGVRPARQRLVCERCRLPPDVPDGVAALDPAGRRAQWADGSRPCRSGWRRLGGGPGRTSPGCPCRRDGRLRREAAARPRARCRGGLRLRRVRRRGQGRSRHRPCRRLRLRGLAQGPQPTRLGHRDRLHERPLAGRQPAAPRRPERLGARVLPRPPDGSGAGSRPRGDRRDPAAA